MRHGIRNDIDPKRIGTFQRVLLKILDILSFTLPTVGHIVVVTKEGHQSMFVVEVAPEMRRRVSMFKRSMPVFVGHADLPSSNAGYLR